MKTPFVPFPPGTIRGPYYPQPYPAPGNRFMVQGHNGWIPVYHHRHETLAESRARAEETAAQVLKDGASVCRLHLRNVSYAVEFPDTPDGMQQARQFRRDNPAFARRRIRHILQLKPSEVPPGIMYQIT